KRSSLDLHFFAYGSFPLYVLKLAGYLASQFDFRYAIDNLRLVGRVLNALVDTVTVLLVYLIGAWVFGRRAGLIVVMLAALTVLNIQQSHFYIVDVPMTLFIVLTVWLALRFIRSGRLLDAAFLGVALGLAVSTKVSVAPVALPALLGF